MVSILRLPLQGPVEIPITEMKGDLSGDESNVSFPAALADRPDLSKLIYLKPPVTTAISLDTLRMNADVASVTEKVVTSALAVVDHTTMGAEVTVTEMVLDITVVQLTKEEIALTMTHDVRILIHAHLEIAIAPLFDLFVMHVGPPVTMQTNVQAEPHVEDRRVPALIVDHQDAPSRPLLFKQPYLILVLLKVLPIQTFLRLLSVPQRIRNYMKTIRHYSPSSLPMPLILLTLMSPVTPQAPSTTPM